MNIIKIIGRWLRSLGSRGAVKQEIDEELRFHVEQRTAANLAVGMTSEEAARQARKSFGNLQSVREECRELRGASYGEQTLQDVRFGLRMLRKNPGFSIVTVLTLALGIGVATTGLSIVHDVILASPPYPHAQRLVLVSPERTSGQPHSRAWPAGHWHAFRTQLESFDALACYEWAFDFLLLPSGSQSISGMTVSKDYFDIIGTEPLLGRRFSAEELQPHTKETVIILGHDLWQQRFNADPKIVGKSVSLGRWPALTVVGVMPPGLRFLPSPQEKRDPSYDLHARVEYWLPAAPDPGKPQEGSVQIIGRLQEGISVGKASAEVTTVSSRYVKMFPDYEGVRASVHPLTRVLNVEGERLLIPMVVSVVLVFLIACSNVSGLLLARGLKRQQDYAIRSALGAQTLRILRSILTESLLLAIGGGICGAILAALLLRVLGDVNGHGLPPMNALRFDWSFVWISLGVAVLAAVMSGGLPALRATQLSPKSALATVTRSSSTGRGERRLLRAMTVLQTALTLALLTGAGLLIRTAFNLACVQPGYRTGNILTMSVTLVKGNWFDFHTRTLQQVKALPGISSAAFVWGLPLTGNAWMGAVQAADEPEKPLKDREAISIRAVTPEYFETVCITMVAGRELRNTDVGNGGRDIPGDAPVVVVINQALAKACFQGRDPLGKRLRLSWRPDQPEIVGVVSDTKTDDLAQSPRPELYFSMWQAPAWVKHLVVRTKTAPRPFAATIERTLRSLEPAVAVEHVKTLEEIRQDSVAMQTLMMRLLLGFSCCAGLLALIGLYGLIAFNMGARRKEFAIRSAVGAQRLDILRLVLGEGLRTIISGLILGSGVAFLLGKLLRGFLYDVQPTDPATLVGAALLFVIAGLLACWFPARRAARIQPMEALRHE